MKPKKILSEWPQRSGLVLVLSLAMIFSACPDNTDPDGENGADVGDESTRDGRGTEDLSPDASAGDAPSADARMDLGSDTTVGDVPDNPDTIGDIRGEPDLVIGDGCETPIDDISITFPDSPTWQRGVVSLAYELAAVGGGDFTVEVAFSFDEESFWAASPLDGYGDGAGPVGVGGHHFVWASSSDSSDDRSQVWARIQATDTSDRCNETVFGPFPLLNDPNRPRAVVLTNAINVYQGGEFTQHSNVRILRWEHNTGLSLIDDEVYTPDAPPDRVVFEPSGRVAVTFGQEDEDLTVFVFDQNGLVTDQYAIGTPGHQFSESEFNADGSVLYLRDSSWDEHGGGLYTIPCDPWTGRPDPAAEPTLLSPIFSPDGFAQRAEQRGFVILRSSGEDPAGDLVLETTDLSVTTIDAVTFAPPVGVPPENIGEALALSPDEAWVLTGHMNFFYGDQGEIRLFGLDAGAAIQVPASGAGIASPWPQDIAFHSGSRSALYTQLGPDRVFSVSITAGGTLAEGDELILGAADRITSTSVGADRDVFFITTVHPSDSSRASGVAMFTLAADGSLSEWCATGLDCSSINPFYLGPGADRLPADIAIQP